MKRVDAQIIWISSEDRGRKKVLPIGTRYCSIIKVKGIKDSNEQWSTDFICTNRDNNTSYINFCFLSEEAPKEILVSGLEFELFEGNRKVAYGIILFDHYNSAFMIGTY